MQNLRRLMQFVQDAPAGTLVPVESLREFLAVDGTEASDGGDAPRMLTPCEAAEWLHAQLGGRKRTPAAVRKIMRTGFRGVVLKSYAYGRERRTTEADLHAFVAQIGAVPRLAVPEKVAIPALLASQTVSGFQVKSAADPADEIAAAQARFRRRKQPPLGDRGPQRRAAGGA